MSPERIAKLRSLIASVTDGEWGADGMMVVTPPVLESVRRVVENEMPFTASGLLTLQTTRIPDMESASNALFTATARNVFTELLDEIERWRAGGLAGWRAGVARLEYR